MRFTGEQLAQMAGVQRQTFMRQVQYLIAEGKFQKSMDLRGFSEVDLENLSTLLGFKIKPLQKNGK